MSEKRFYCDDVGEYRNYAIFDTSKCEKSKEDFYDAEEECYDLIAFEDYLLENDCILVSDDVVDLLNSQNGLIDVLGKENEQLRKTEKINEEYAEQLVEQNKKLRIAKNDLRNENEKLKRELECCEYRHFLKEQKNLREKVEKGDISDFSTLRVSDEGKEHWQ